MIDFLSSFIDKISTFFSLIVSLPSRFISVFYFILSPFNLISDGFADIIISVLGGVFGFLMIYFIVKLVLELL